MNLAKIQVSGVRAVATEAVRELPAGIVGATVELEYTGSIWAGLNKTVIFRGNITKEVLTNETTVTVPAEVLAEPRGRLRVGVYGTDAANNVIMPTLWAELGVIADSAEPSVPADSALPVWAQLWDMIGNLGNLDTETKTSIVAAINELVANAGTSDPEEIKKIVETYLAENPPRADDQQIADAVEEYMKDHSGENVDYVGVEPAEDDIPKVFFGGTLQQTKDEKVVPFRYISKTEDISGYAEIKAQGNSSMNYPKKNQTVKLFKDAECTEKLKVDFKGWGKQNKHVYKANWIDLSHARNVVSARLWADVVRSRANFLALPQLLRTSPNVGAVDGFPVKVYADGVYQGRYTLNIPKDKWTFNMDDELDNHCVLCGENYASGCFRALANINGADWTDEIHDTVPASIKTRWNEVISFVMDSTDEEFKANLGNYFYVDSLIDYYLYALASCGLDSLGKNQLYMTYDGQKWLATMYDMDSTWGLYYTGGQIVSTDYARTQYEDWKNAGGNLLYIRLEQLFVDELQARWAELKSGALSIENIINRFERFTDIAPAELIKEDYASTTGGGKFTGIPSQTTNNIQQIRSFALARQAWTDSYVSALNGSGEQPEDPDVPIIPDEPVVEPIEPSVVVPYSLPEETTFNGTSDYIDTGVQLCSYDNPFSIAFHATNGTGNTSAQSNTIFHCMKEEVPFPGFSFGVAYNATAYKFGAFGVNRNINIPLDGSEIKVVITYSGGNANLKCLYDGNITEYTFAVTFVSAVQNLLLGCYQATDGTKGRFWNGTLHDFKVFDYVMNDAEIEEYMYGQAPIEDAVVLTVPMAHGNNLNTSNGELSEKTTAFATDYVDVSGYDFPIDLITTFGYVKVCGYDANHTFVETLIDATSDGCTEIYDISIPSGIKYIRVSAEYSGANEHNTCEARICNYTELRLSRGYTIDTNGQLVCIGTTGNSRATRIPMKVTSGDTYTITCKNGWLSVCAYDDSMNLVQKLNTPKETVMTATVTIPNGATQLAWSCSGANESAHETSIVKV